MHGAGQVLDDHGGLASRQRRAAQFVGQAAAVDELERQEVLTAGLADLVDLNDVRVLQPGDSLGLDAEAGELLGAGVRTGQDHLQGHEPIQGHLFGLVDDAHAAPAEQADDFVPFHGGPLDRFCRATGKGCGGIDAAAGRQGHRRPLAEGSGGQG